MNSSTRRTAAASALALAATLGGATAAEAAVAAGGYWVAECHPVVSVGGLTSKNAKLRLSNYPVAGGKQRYHYGMKSDGALLPLVPYKLTANGVAVGNIYDGFKTYPSRSTEVTWKATWKRGLGTYSCTIRR